MRIEICGGIASGKTTLASSLAARGIREVNERFQENPFFSKFYLDPAKYAFETEITYLLQHFSQVHECVPTDRVVTDFSLALDLAYAHVTLGSSDREVFETVLNRCCAKISPPSLIVRLNCSIPSEMSRIQSRGRPAEQAISESFLQAIDDAIGYALKTKWYRGVPVVQVDSTVCDFRPGGKGREGLTSEIMTAVM